ncbi:MAG: nitroreductase [Betaproteobacteria bacterium]|jgi:nitroreductase
MQHPNAPASEAVGLEALLAGRYSCRAYRDAVVPRETIEAAMALAQRTPSWCNTQPWQVHLASGRSREKVSAALLAAAVHPGQPDFPFPEAYRGVYRDRRKVCGVQLYESLGIGRDDRERAHAQSLENYRGFGAPHMAFITTDQALGVYGAVDCGLYLMNLMLALRACGVDSIAQAALASHPQVVRNHFQLPASRLVVFGLSFGYGEPSSPINGYRTQREEVVSVLQWTE